MRQEDVNEKMPVKAGSRKMYGKDGEWVEIRE